MDDQREKKKENNGKSGRVTLSGMALGDDMNGLLEQLLREVRGGPKQTSKKFVLECVASGDFHIDATSEKLGQLLKPARTSQKVLQGLPD